jgi:Na+-translocating ferredoxin:NAD+ oxidoreductase RnfD subunit
MDSARKQSGLRKSSLGRIRRFVNTPKGLVLALLVVISLISALATKGMDWRALGNAAVGAGTGLIVDLLVGLFYQRKRFFSDGGIITGLIVAMVFSSFTPWYVVSITTAIGLMSKHVLKVRQKPVFNPAAFGLLVSSYLFASMQSWWGGMSLVSNWYLIVLVAAGIWVTWRVKKFPQVIAFLTSYALFCLILMLFKSTHDNAMFALENPMLNSALFLAFFMLTDPPTSPAKWRHQVWFGCLVGLVSVGVYMVYPAELTYLLIGLLVANAMQFVQHLWLKSSASKKSVVMAKMKSHVGKEGSIR